MKSDVKGCSTTAPGQEKYETFEHRGKTMYLYEYRGKHSKKLFTCRAKSLDEARKKCEAWKIEQLKAMSSAEKLEVVSRAIGKIN